MDEFEMLWQELCESAENELDFGMNDEVAAVAPVNESIKLIFVEIPVSALRG